MSFRQFATNVAGQFDRMQKGNRELFVVDGMEDLFQTYLSAFPPGTDPIFRTRTVHDCSCCRSFIKNVGNVIAIKNDRVVTIWENTQGLEPVYKTVAERMDWYVRQYPIRDVFVTSERRFGHHMTIGDKRLGPNHTFDHFWTMIEANYHSNTPDAVRGRHRTNHDVLKRALNEIKLSALDQALELINNDMLYRGREHEANVRTFKKVREDWYTAPNKDAFIWQNSGNMAAVGFRNSVIGTLVQDISDDVDLEAAVKMFESKVAPQNYKRSKSLITGKMVDEALAKLEELGLSDSIERRVAVFEDVSVNDVIFVNNAGRMKMKDGLKAKILKGHERAIPTRKSNNNITIDRFIAEVLPNATDLRVLMENKHIGNLMTLTAPKHRDAKPLFRWGNGFAWSYKDGNADSIRERVKRAGGNVDAALRVSLSWFNGDDLDLHSDSNQGHIFYGNRREILDVDMNAGGITNLVDPVENQSFKNPLHGPYRFWVHNFNKRSLAIGRQGFEIEFFYNGQTRHFSHNHSVGNQMNVKAFSFTLTKDGIKNFVLERDNRMVEAAIGKSVWGIQTETMQSVTSLMISPNHWESASMRLTPQVGAMHWMFILDGCATPDPTRGIYNEFLRPDLHEHRKVFEILGGKTMCDPLPNQMSGLGFTLGRGDEITAVVVTANGNMANFNITF